MRSQQPDLMGFQNALLLESCEGILCSNSHMQYLYQKHIVLSPIILLCTDRLFQRMGECREVLGGGPAPPLKLCTLRVQPGSQT